MIVCIYKDQEPLSNILNIDDNLRQLKLITDLKSNLKVIESNC